MLKYIFYIFLLVAFSGCQDIKQSESQVKVFGNNNLFKNSTKEAEIKNRLEIKKLETQAKVEIAKIQSNSQLEIAKINSKTSKDIANTDADVKIKTTKLDVEALKTKSKITLYIAIAFAVVLIIAIIVFYLNSKKNRELKEKLHLKEMEHKQRELEEKRLHKMLDLIADGKISKDVEKEVLLTMTRSNIKLLS